MQVPEVEDDDWGLAMMQAWFVDLDQATGAAAGLTAETRRSLMSATVTIAAEQTAAELRVEEAAERARSEEARAEDERRRALARSRAGRLALFFGYIVAGLTLMQVCQGALMTSYSTMNGFLVFICWVIAVLGPWPYAFGAGGLAGQLWQNLNTSIWFIGVAAFLLATGVMLWRTFASA